VFIVDCIGVISLSLVRYIDFYNAHNIVKEIIKTYITRLNNVI
jgi:hypothetical protein